MNWIKLTSGSYYIDKTPEGYNLPCMCPLHVGKLLLRTACGGPSFHRLLPPVNLLLSATVPFINLVQQVHAETTSNIPNKHFPWTYFDTLHKYRCTGGCTGHTSAINCWTSTNHQGYTILHLDSRASTRSHLYVVICCFLWGFHNLSRWSILSSRISKLPHYLLSTRIFFLL